MKHPIIAATLVAASTTAALADGIQPITPAAPAPDVTVGSQTFPIDPVYIGIGAAAIVIILAAAAESDGTN